MEETVFTSKVGGESNNVKEQDVISPYFARFTLIYKSARSRLHLWDGFDRKQSIVLSLGKVSNKRSFVHHSCTMEGTDELKLAQSVASRRFRVSSEVAPIPRLYIYTSVRTGRCERRVSQS